MSVRDRMLSGCLVWLMVVGCSGSPEPRLASAEDVLQLKMQGVDESGLLTWVKDPSRTFNLLEPDFERLSRAGVGEVVLGELRVRTEEYRRSAKSGRQKPHHVEKPNSPHGDGHRH